VPTTVEDLRHTTHDDQQKFEEVVSE
jgi:hypothetical protein